MAKKKTKGWLDKFEEPEMQLGGFVYPTNYVPQAQNGLEASTDGFTDQGFNYNGAWGGTMEYGGDIPQAQNGLWNTNKTQWVDSIHNARRGDLDFVNRYFDPSAGSIPTPRDVEGWKPGQTSTHLMRFDPGTRRVYPSVVNVNGKLKYLPGDDESWNYADDTKEFIEFPTAEQAKWYSSNGYKKGTNVLKGKSSAPKKAMGGSLPGSVGFSYARTGDIPSNGPYAKKTLASAKDGEEITPTQFYNEYLKSPNYINRLKLQGYKDPKKTINDRLNNLNKTKVTNVKGVGNVYNPGQNTINLDSEEQKKYNLNPLSTKVHEYSHAAGSLGNYLTFPEEVKNTTLNRKEINLIDRGNRFWNLDLGDRKKYSIDKAMEIDHDRRASEVKADMDVLRYNLKKDKMYDTGTQNFNQEHLNKSKNKYKNNKVINRLFDRYSDKDLINLMNTVAKTDDDYDLSFAQNGHEMSFYQNGLDWTPRNISQDGTNVKKPRTDMLTMDEYRLKKALANQPVIQSPKGKQLTKEQILAKNQQYAEERGKRFNPNTGAVTPFLSPTAARIFERGSENIVEPMIDLEMVMGGAPLVGKGLKTAGKFLTEETALKNAYKLNPWAFKTNPEAYYRGIGRSGLDDAFETGKLRTANKTGNYGEDLYLTDNFNVASGNYSRDQSYGIGDPWGDDWKMVAPKDSKSYMAEIPESAFTNKHIVGNSDIGTIAMNKGALPIDNIKFLKQHWLKGYKEVPKPKKKEGGEITKDDNGYWNPENWGKPVEIGSNNITMQGVNQPLVGVSDTGDTKMMYPGEDYEFDGEKVTEYPVAQNGKTVPPLYVSNPNDPRLKAYNDSLSIYNTTSQQYKNIKKTGKLRDSDIDVDSEKKYSFKDYMDEYNRPNSDFNIFNSGTNSKMQPINVSQFRGKGILGYLDYGRQAQYKKPVQEVILNPPSNAPKKPKPKPQPVKKKTTPQPEPVQEQPIKKTEPPKPVEVKQNVYEGSPVYSNMLGSGDRSALVGFVNPQGDTTYIKPEDYQRYGVPAYGKELIESKTKKKKNGGWLDKYN